jgi:hypothetical protein
MNGTGKGGLRLDPGSENFVANVNTTVNLSVKSASGSNVLASVHYDSLAVPVNQNSFTLTILEGSKELRLHVLQILPGGADLLDSNGNRLAQLDSETAVFLINGV